MSEIKQVWGIIKDYKCADLKMVQDPALAVFQHQQAKIEKLENELSTTKQVLGNVIDMEVAKVDNLKAQLNNMEACYIKKKKEVEDQHKKVDEVLEYLNGESANRWGLWKEKADMLDQGASNAFEEAYWMAKKVLRGES
ncbi:hypothetical protein [Acinetobacter lwoffii]|uniref:hypothetical protein n=1 Tax=Acinetobacter lwoffii TaxID=28090 RepID=UPI003F91C168